MTHPKYGDIKSLLESGVIQEANRQFFHPLGLALEVIQEKDGTCSLGGIWDYTDNPSGISYDLSQFDLNEFRQKAQIVSDLKESKSKARIEALGSVVQKLPERI